MEWDNKKLDEYTIKYPNAKKRIGAMFYPLIVEITNNLNSKYHLLL